MNLDLSAFTPEQIAALKAQLDGISATGRSPVRVGRFGDPRQLDDLRLAPTAEDPRPTFFWSAPPPRNAGDLTKTALYPRLMWDGTTGQEITVSDLKAEQTATAKGFILTPPANAEVPDEKALLRQQLEALSPEDRALLVDAAKRDRLARLQAQMASLSEADLEALAGTVETTVEKRGPGRPRKAEVA